MNDDHTPADKAMILFFRILGAAIVFCIMHFGLHIF